MMTFPEIKNGPGVRVGAEGGPEGVLGTLEGLRGLVPPRVCALISMVRAKTKIARRMILNMGTSRTPGIVRPVRGRNVKKRLRIQAEAFSQSLGKAPLARGHGSSRRVHVDYIDQCVPAAFVFTGRSARSSASLYFSSVSAGISFFLPV